MGLETRFERKLSMFNHLKVSTAFKAALICLMCAFIGACSPSSEGETEDWNKNKTKTAELVTAFPGFKTVLDAELASATKMWGEAGKAGDAKKNAEAMKKTNDYLEELIDPLAEIQSKSSAIEDTISKLGKLKLVKKSSESSKRKRVMSDIGDTKSAVAATLSAAAPKDRAEALALIDAEKSKIVSAWSKGNRTLSSLKGGKKKGKKDKKKSKKDKKSK